MSDAALSQADAAGGTLRKMALISLIGTSIEFYDFFIFGTAAALVFPSVFFPKGVAPLLALLASFSTFAVGFFARPLGAAIFGHFGDRLGRKRMLVIALLLMGAATTVIGVLPSYQRIGNLSPLLLVLMRFIQGFALGGQWGGAVLIILENAPVAKRGWYGAFAQVGAPLGTILANLAFLIVSTLTSHEAFLSWGWRIPFLMSLVLIGLSVFIQLRLEETLEFHRLKEAERQQRAAQAAQLSAQRRIALETAMRLVNRSTMRSPALQALRLYPRKIVLAAGAFVGMQASYYLMVSFSLAYGTNPLAGNMASSTMLTAVLLGAVAMVPGVFAGAWISDRAGRRGIIMASAALLALWLYALFPLIRSGTLFGAAIGLCVGQFLNGMIFGPLAAMYTEMFATPVRYSGMSLAYQLGTLIGGALSPLIATALFAHYHSSVPISIYVSCACGISVLSAWLIKETSQTALLEQGDDQSAIFLDKGVSV
jgi:MFS family permease